RDLVSQKTMMLLLDLSTGRHRLESVGNIYIREAKQFSPRVTTTVFTGKDLRTESPRQANTRAGYTPPQPNPEVGIMTGNLRSGANEVIHLPLFFGHGIVPSIDAPVLPDQLRTRVDPTTLYVHGRGVHAGRPCLVLRTHAVKYLDWGFDEFWVDTERDSA